jgi:hypothetical protein
LVARFLARVTTFSRFAAQAGPRDDLVLERLDERFPATSIINRNHHGGKDLADTTGTSTPNSQPRSPNRGVLRENMPVHALASVATTGQTNTYRDGVPLGRLAPLAHGRRIHRQFVRQGYRGRLEERLRNNTGNSRRAQLLPSRRSPHDSGLGTSRALPVT